MSKERFLTVLIPIKDEDCETTVYASLAALQSAVPPTVVNLNKIYKVEDGTYYRSTFDSSNDTYEYQAVVDREFPSLGNPLEIFDFTYDAIRMGEAPTISAQGVFWFAEKDGSGNDVTLDGLWNENCHVVFNGERYYLKRIPSSSKSNEDARYKYDMDFVSERVILESVFLYDVVAPFVTEKPISESSSFSMFGDIEELAKRINASLIRSGISSLTRKYVNYPNRTETVPHLSYEQWNQVNVNPQSLVPSVFVNIGELNFFRTTIYNALNADYNLYLMQYVYVNDNGVYSLTGYQCVIGMDKKGEPASSEEKLVTFENNTIHEALQQFHDTFDSQYYITKEKDAYGAFTGNTLIVVGDCEHDFADWDEVSGDYVRDAEGIPTTENPFDYGVEDELLMKEKTNTTDKIVTRITGVGSAENIPWHYPNPNPDGWIKPVFFRDGEEQQSVGVDYPIDEGSTVEDSVRYEKYLKNRIGNALKKGVVKDVFFANDYSSSSAGGGITPSDYMSVYHRYVLNTQGIQYPRMTIEISYNASESGCNRIVASMYKGNLEVGAYDSSETYENPTDFQTMFANRDGGDLFALAPVSYYFLDITYKIPLASRPNSKRWVKSGYHYNSQTIQPQGAIPTSLNTAWIREDFYQYPDLIAFVAYDMTGAVTDAGYSTDGTASGKVSPISRSEDVNYKDVDTGVIYRCNNREWGNIHSDNHQNAYTENPKMGKDEWFSTFVQMTLNVHSNDGWYIGGKKVELEDYGLGEPEQGGTAISTDIFDEIAFQRLKYVTPQQNLMPEVYVKTDGERRFYNAHNYWDKDNDTLYEGVADTMIGEVQVQDKVRNPIYKENESDADNEHYDFENEYVQTHPHEHIENFDDVKPTIEGQTGYVKVTSKLTEEEFNADKTFFYTWDANENVFVQCTASSVYSPALDYYALLRIDVMEEFGYDSTDNDEVWESSDDGNVQGEYKHPYFFAKLRPLGFNLFDLALQEDMVVSMTTGDCGACNFKIGVDEKTKKNPVQIWQYDVHRGETFSTKGDVVYQKGTPRRYVDLDGLYFNTNNTQNGYVPVKQTLGVVGQTSPKGNNASPTPIFDTYSYSAEDVANGYVGSTRKGNATHFEGDIVTNGRFIDEQQDTSENYVWVALMKDTDTYGTLMPSARRDYNDANYNVYIRPKSVADVHDGTTIEEDDEKADKFVLLNIRMPQMYLRRAERMLSRKLVAYMYDNNYQKFNFSIKFSRIFIQENSQIDNLMNENSVLYVMFNGHVYRQYVKHYSYRMSHDGALPETIVDMNDELSVSRTIVQQWQSERKKDIFSYAAQSSSAIQQVTDKAAINNAIQQSQNTSFAASSLETEIQYKALEWGEF